LKYYYELFKQSNIVNENLQAELSMNGSSEKDGDLAYNKKIFGLEKKAGKLVMLTIGSCSTC
jgi:hypothetical protein